MIHTSAPSIESKAHKFLEYVKPYTPHSQIMRFLNLIETDRRELALRLADHFLELSLGSELIGCFEIIRSRLPVRAD